MTLENALYYVIFLASGLLVWAVLRYFFRRFAHTGIRSVIMIFLLLVVIPLLLFCRPAKPDNPDSHNPIPSSKGRNVILISVDTLRYDRLGCNFNENIRTPNIDELAGAYARDRAITHFDAYRVDAEEPRCACADGSA